MSPRTCSAPEYVVRGVESSPSATPVSVLSKDESSALTAPSASGLARKGESDPWHDLDVTTSTVVRACRTKKVHAYHESARSVD